MGWIGETVDSIRSIQTRRAIEQVVTLGIIASSALMLWKGSMCLSWSESPVVVVLSESMEPGFQRGDILLLHLNKDPIHSGDIVVYNIDGRTIPIVHRVIEVHGQQETKEFELLTKGDNNPGDDRTLYAENQLWLKQHHIMGKAIGFIPYVGWLTIIMTEMPLFKYILLSILALLVITSD